ncbi:DUF6879 family protein [Streptomyces sp. NPDC088725]|uniref:DUF6879 family protein n=1 Tax=Streptomyces sp. NPDC088725 TaxID=3365873 RepID=UPI003826680F
MRDPDVPTVAEPDVPALTPELGERLLSKDYKRDFRERQAAIHDGASWKLERRQHFEEQGDASRDALSRGDWHEALRVFDEERDALITKARENKRRGYVFHRVRVVEQPVTPYVQWELHALHQQAELGGNRVRIVTADADEVARAERTQPLPEIVVLGSRTLYHVLYTDTGRPSGAIRFTDRQQVEAWERYIRSLYEAGEDITTYFPREIAPLPEPLSALSPAPVSLPE